MFNTLRDHLLNPVKDRCRRTRPQRRNRGISPCDGPKRHAHGGDRLVIPNLVTDAQRIGWSHATLLQHAANVRLLAEDGRSTGVTHAAGSRLRTEYVPHRVLAIGTDDRELNTRCVKLSEHGIDAGEQDDLCAVALGEQPRANAPWHAC